MGPKHTGQWKIFYIQMWERLTKDDKADEDDVYCELPDGSLDVPFPVEIIQKACYIFCLISHPE